MPIYRLKTCLSCATLCPNCHDRVDPRDVHLELYGMGKHTTAHLYAVPVLERFDAVRNCSHCRRSTDDDCKAWRKFRKSVAVLRQECRRYAKGVDELSEATRGCMAIIYEFADGSVGLCTEMRIRTIIDIFLRSARIPIVMRAPVSCLWNPIGTAMVYSDSVIGSMTSRLSWCQSAVSGSFS